MDKPWDSGILRVMDNKQYFANGTKPFFMLGDTAWTLFQKLTKDESYTYLKNRKEKGFTTIAAVFVNFQSRSPKSYFGDVAEYDITEFLKPSHDEYWKHIESVVAMAEELGLYMALLPVWGNVVKDGKLNEQNAEAYTNFLIEKFARFPNICWVLGGDIRGDANFGVWDKMGALFKAKDSARLVSYHPFGRTCSSYWFQDCEWLDFHMFQSGHRRSDQRQLNAWDEAVFAEPWFGEESYRYVQENLNKLPKRPILDGEPSYEMIPQGLHNPSEPYWQAHHVRRYAYWSVLSGAAGHIYGHNAIIQFFGTGSDPVYGALETWDLSIHDVGSSHMQIMKNLLEEIDFANSKPMQNVVFAKSDFNAAFGNKRHVLIYSYSGKPFSVNAVAGETEGEFEGYWIDPCSGVRSYLGNVKLDGKPVEFSPPNKKTDFNDWLLHLARI